MIEIKIDSRGETMGNHIRYVYYFTLFIWAKFIAIQFLYFDLPIHDWMDVIIVLFGTLSSAVILSIITILIARKRLTLGFFLCSLFSSILVIAHVLYYRSFHDFITIPVLFQSANVSSIQHSVLHLIQFPKDLLIFADPLILGTILLGKKTFFNSFMIPKTTIHKTTTAFVSIVAICLFVNWTVAQSSTNELTSKWNDRADIVKHAGLLNYQIYDLASFVQGVSKKWFSSEENLDEVNDQMDDLIEEATDEQTYPGYSFGVAEGKNVIMISMESMHDFTLGMEIAGQEVTPFLNELVEESMYFSEFYHQTGQGKTSDSEFIVENSLFPVTSGSVFFTHANNEYFTLTHAMKENGYHASVFHANDSSFWNREEMYKAIGYDEFFDVDSFSVPEEEVIGWGLSDIEFFRQSTELIQTLPEPFFGKWITLTNHHPFELDLYEDWRADMAIEDETLKQYFSTVRYTDEAIRQFFQRLKQIGVYEDSIFVLYGDHYGISPQHYEALGELLDKKMTPDEHIKLQQVPFIIHIPGTEGFQDERVAGQVDVRPTLLSLLGIEDELQPGFGQNLITKERFPFAAFRDGSVVTEDMIYTEEKCYNKHSGDLIALEVCEPAVETAHTLLNISDEIIYGDLLRFVEKDK